MRGLTEFQNDCDVTWCYFRLLRNDLDEELSAKHWEHSAMLVLSLPKPAMLLFATCVLAAAACVQDDGGTATTPIPRDEVYWRKLHDSYVERAKQKNIELLFLGDSITQGWNDNEAWKRHYGPRKAANFGIGGDRTEHVLWRLENGTIDGLSPRAVVLMIGTNNIGSN